jgi:ribosomal protein L19
MNICDKKQVKIICDKKKPGDEVEVKGRVNWREKYCNMMLSGIVIAVYNEHPKMVQLVVSLYSCT